MDHQKKTGQVSGPENEPLTPGANPPGSLEAPQSGSKLDVLLQIMLEERARQAQEDKAKRDGIAAKQAQRNKNAASNFEDDKTRQCRCQHLKGGKNRLRTQVKDYAVYMHTFVNGERVIRCMLCNMKWKIRDTAEFLYRFGQKVPNHTGLGWKEAMGLLADSSNKPSSSEIPMSATPAAQPQLDEN